LFFVISIYFVVGGVESVDSEGLFERDASSGCRGHRLAKTLTTCVAFVGFDPVRKLFRLTHIVFLSCNAGDFVDFVGGVP
jgi:hypothetical protein